MSRIRTFTQTVYAFDELDDAARERALTYFREREAEDFGSFAAEDVIEVFKEEHLVPFGLHDATIYFSGFWSQGDGACIFGRVDLGTWIRKTGNYHRFRKVYNRAVAYDVDARIERGFGRYFHEYTVQAHVETNTSMWLDDDYWAQERQVEDELTEWIRERSREVYKALEEEYWYRQEDESIIELIEANEYEFDRMGNFPPQVFDLAEAV